MIEPRSIEAWKTTDDEVFERYADAQIHEFSLEVNLVIDEWDPDTPIEWRDAIVDFLWRRAEVLIPELKAVLGAE